MKILYYNWVQFDNEKNQGGGVNVYQRNLIGSLTHNTNNEIYFLSSGWKYNPLKTKTYIQETSNIFKDKCRSFEIINSSIMAPAFAMFMNPRKFIDDMDTYEIFDEFISKYGPFDVIHFNNIEGISVNVLKLKEKYPSTKFIVSIHNYQPICPLNQYFQNHNKCICHNYDNGNECLKCSEVLPSKKEYYKRCKYFYYDKYKGYLKFLRLPFKLFSKLFKGQSSKYIGSLNTMKPQEYVEYRKHNFEVINKYADKILAVSERVRNIMLEHGYDSQKVVTSYIGTKFAEQELGYSVATKTKPFTIAYLGYEREDKGYFFLINALSKLDNNVASNINVVLAVKNIHKKYIENKLDNFNEVIIYNGYSHKELQNILHSVNLGIVPVLWEDNLPQVAIEMVACGVPILCSDFGGASELCASELFKFQGGNEKNFINKLVTLYKTPELLNEYWSNHSKLTTMDEHINSLMSLYDAKEVKL